MVIGTGIGSRSRRAIHVIERRYVPMSCAQGRALSGPPPRGCPVRQMPAQTRVLASVQVRYGASCAAFTQPGSLH